MSSEDASNGSRTDAVTTSAAGVSDGSPASGSASATATTAATTTTVNINSKLFWLRMEALTRSWQSDARWNVASAGASPASTKPPQALMVAIGSSDTSETFTKLTAFQLWLFSYELTDTLIVITNSPLHAHIITSAKKARHLKPVSDAQPTTIGMTLYENNRVDSNRAHLDAIFSSLRDANDDAAVAAVRIGVIPDKVTPEEERRGVLAQSAAYVQSQRFETVDISTQAASVWCVCDGSARATMEKSAELTSRALKKVLLPRIEEIIDEEQTVRQDLIADEVDEKVRKVTALGLKNPNDVVPDDLDVCYVPIIQSGGDGEAAEYDLRPSAVSPELPLAYGNGTTIFMQIGCKYRNYCTNIGRTYFINPSEYQKRVYSLLTQIYATCKQVLQHGNKANMVMLNAQRVIQQSKLPELQSKFTKNCGFCIGLEFRDANWLLTEKNARTLVKNMCFNLCIGFSELVDPKTNKRFAVYLSDTMLVTEKEAQSLTMMPREFSEVTYTLGDDAEAAAVVDDKSAIDLTVDRARSTRTHARNAKGVEAPDEDIKKVHARQEELQRRLQEEALATLSRETVGALFEPTPGNDKSKFHSYRSPLSYPADARAQRDRVFVDERAESLLLPIHDQLVPFHINTVKNVQKHTDGAHTLLRITFVTPDAKTLQAAYAAYRSGQPTAIDPRLQFISELTFRSATDSLDVAFTKIKELLKTVQNRAKELEARRSLVEQAELILEKNVEPPSLRDVSVRPALSRKKNVGTLYAHKNGFRYITSDRDSKVDVLYANVKACFYQPAENSHQVLLHFELKNAILFDKTSKTKKTTFVQVFFEVIESSEDLGTANRFRDEDGLEEEKMERQRRRRWNERFLEFVRRVEDRTKVLDAASRLKFDVPFQDLAFEGVPSKSGVTLLPTVNYLVALEDTPPLVLPLADIQVASLERVQFHLKNFDMILVWRDFNQLPMPITLIPTKFLEPIKKWLTEMDIVFFESPQNMVWKNVMKEINKDPEAFWRDGGFASFLGEGDGVDDSEREESGSEFEPEEASEEEEMSEEYETDSEEGESEGDDDDDDDDYSDEDDDDDDEGDDWETLDAKAMADDKKRSQQARQQGLDDWSDDDEGGRGGGGGARRSGGGGGAARGGRGGGSAAASSTRGGRPGVAPPSAAARRPIATASGVSRGASSSATGGVRRVAPPPAANPFSRSGAVARR